MKLKKINPTLFFNIYTPYIEALIKSSNNVDLPFTLHKNSTLIKKLKDIK